MLRIAHRGASKVAPENTIAAVQEALFLGVDFVEVDARLSKDGIPVVIHDANVSRTTNLKKPLLVEDLTLKELKELDAGSWYSEQFKGEKIPTLEELVSIDFGVTGLMIEVKEGRTPVEVVAKNIMKSLKNRNCAISIGSFSKKIVETLIPLAENCVVMGIIEKADNIAGFVEMGLKRLAIWYRLIDRSLIQALHEKNIEVWTFTVDDIKKAQFLNAIGIDGIITNNPKKLSEVSFR